MRALLLLCTVLVACSSSAKQPAKPGTGTGEGSTTDDATAPSSVKVALGNLVVPNAIAVTRTTFEHFVVASFVHDTIGPGAPCLKELERGVVATYQVQTPEPSSYFVLEGNLPKATALKCIPESFKMAPDGGIAVDVEQSGELVVFDLGDLGQVYAAWRDRYVVVGEQKQVTAALGSATDTANPWLARIAASGTAPIWAYRTDRLPESLFGIAAQAYLVELDRLVLSPQVQFAGRMTIWYRSGADAVQAARRVKAGELLVQGTQGLVDAFVQMKVKQNGNAITMTFDQTMFSLVDIDDFMNLVSRWAAGVN